VRSSAGRTPVVLGIDLSFRGPACVVIPAKWDLKIDDGLPYQDGVFDKKGEKVPDRMERIAFSLVGVADGFKVTHAFIEGYAFGLATRAHGSLLMELGGVVKYYFWKDLGIELVPVAAGTARKFLLGKLPRKYVKVFVQEKVYAMGAPKSWSDNAVDSFVIANYGRHSLGLPALSVGE
jgi:hypothetical protein